MSVFFFHDVWIIRHYYEVIESVNRKMYLKNSTIGILIVLAGVGTIFVNHEFAWIISAVLIGGGTGLFFWKDKKNNNEDF